MGIKTKHSLVGTPIFQEHLSLTTSTITNFFCLKLNVTFLNNIKNEKVRGESILNFS